MIKRSARFWPVTPWAAGAVTIGLALWVLLSPSWAVGPWSWHDQQRLGQMALLVAALLWAPWLPWAAILSPAARWRVAALLTAGALACLGAALPCWAWTEWSAAAGLLALAALLHEARRHAGPRADGAAMALMAALALVLSAQVVTAWAAALWRQGPMDAWVLLSGFSNPRFFGQMLTLTTPMLVAALWVSGLPRRWRWALGGLLVVWCWLAWLSGTRGTWLALAGAGVLGGWLGGPWRRWAYALAGFMLAGLVAQLLLVEALPRLLGQPVLNHLGTRMNLSSSGRIEVWAEALRLWWQHPWLGAGPMHYATLLQVPVAHPHSLPLQILSEWGVMGALACLALAWHGAKRAWHRIRPLASPLGMSAATVSWPSAWTLAQVVTVGAGMSIVAALAQSLVDGVHVMPYPQTLWAAMAGWWWAVTAEVCRSDADNRLARPLGDACHQVRMPWPARVGVAAVAWPAAALLVWRWWHDAPIWLLWNTCVSPCVDALQPRWWLRGMIQ